MKKLLACSSGGRTSMYQLEWLLDNKRNEYEICGVFANTGWEHPETLEFIRKCEDRWKEKYDFSLIWVEAVIVDGRVSSKHKIVTYDTCGRNREPFIEMCKKYGVPNKAYPHCTRELKENPIHDYIKTVRGWNFGEYETALGIRIDEPRRIRLNKTKQNKVYPLVDWHPSRPDKLDIIDWWEDQDFDLKIPEHLGNCVGCFRKSKKKTLKVIRDAKELFANDMEIKYGNVGSNKIEGKHVSKPRTMYREYMTSQMMISLFNETPEDYLIDESEEINEGCASSCEPFVEDWKK